MNIVDKLASKEDMVSPGISACVGCNVELTLRTCMKVLGPNTIYAVPPGCMGGVGVVGWDTQSGSKIPVFFPLLDNVASMLAGIKMHYEKQGRDVNVVAFAGDGASTDAGMQCLSGAAERGDKIDLYLLRQRRIYEHRVSEKQRHHEVFMDYHDAHKQRRAGRQKAAQERLPDGDGHA